MIKQINNILDNEFIKLLLVLISGTFMGYTLNPVPVWLNDLFDNSNIFKVLILIIIGITTLHPINSNSLSIVIITSIFTILLFNMLHLVNS